MKPMYTSLFSMSIYGGILILTVLSLRALFQNKLPKQTFPALWCVALFRLLFPFSVPSSLSVYSIVQRQAAALQEQGADGNMDWTAMLSADFTKGSGSLAKEDRINGTDFKEEADSIAGMDFKENADFKRDTDCNGTKEHIANDSGSFGKSLGELSLFQKIGAGGTVACALSFLMMYLNCRRRFRAALPLENRLVAQWMAKNRLARKVKVCRSDRISTPLTYGILRPVILLPKQLEQEEGERLEYILQHELVHIRRFDGAWKFAMAAALCLHWFNPLVWVMYVYMNRDLELSCDEAVLRAFGTEARKGYALTLIGVEESEYSPMPLYSGFGKDAVEERIIEILKYKKKTRIAMGAAAALVMAVACMFATTAKELNESSGAGRNRQGGNVLADALAHPTSIWSYSTGKDDSYQLHWASRQEPAHLVKGKGYCMLFPKKGFVMSAPDVWVSENTPGAEFKVLRLSEEGSEYEGLNKMQVAETLTGQGYQEITDWYYQRYRESEDKVEVAELRQREDGDLLGVFYTYPGEEEESLGVKMYSMARSVILTSGTEVSGGEPVYYEKRAHDMKIMSLAEQFIWACQGHNAADVDQYFKEGCEADAKACNILKACREWSISEPDADSCVTIRATMEDGGEKSEKTLTMKISQDEGEWKICSLELGK